MKVLVACEESQTITKILRELGHEAYSCDLEPCSGGHPEWHLQEDALAVAHRENWDLMIAHPPCTYLTCTGNRWFLPKYRDRYPNRPQQREDAAKFFMDLYNAPIEHIAVENPVGVMSTRFRPPNQYVHPYHFGDPHSKRTGWWLKNLPPLTHGQVVEPQWYTYKSNGKRAPTWHVDSLSLPAKERSRVRSQTFPGMARAVAEQWTTFIEEKYAARAQE